MSQKDPERNPTFSRRAAIVAMSSVVLFVLLLASLHLLEPELDPSTQPISLYELGRYGLLMSLAFFSLSVGVLAIVLPAWSSPHSIGGAIGRWWLVAISVAFFGAGIFYPYRPTNVASVVHGICGLVVILTFPIAATLYSAGLGRRVAWATVLTWIGLLSFIGSSVVLGAMSKNADRSNPNLLIGWQNRFMVLTYAFWIVMASRGAVAVPKR